MKNHHRIRRRVLLVLGCMTAWLGAGAFAESSPPAWPSRPITIIVANPAGSATDTLARIAAEGLSADLKQPVIIDNKPGAQGIIGVQAFKSRQGDDHTLIVSFSGLNSSNPWLFKEQKYHYRDDFTHIVPLVRAPSLLLVNADAAWHSLAQLLQAARQDPARLAYAYGQATSQVMGGAFNHAGGFPELRGIPYRGQPQALTDLMGGRVDFMFADLSVSQPFVAAGKLRALGISTQARSSLMPQVPTLQEQGLADYDLAAWVGLSGPRGMSPAQVERVNRVVSQYFASAPVRQRIAQLGFTPLEASPQEFGRFVEREYEQWGRAIEAAGIDPL